MKRPPITDAIRDYRRWIASQGGQARTQSLTKSERAELARSGGQGRWARVGKKERRELARRLARARWSKRKGT
jgi:hypothetical protein